MTSDRVLSDRSCNVGRANGFILAEVSPSFPIFCDLISIAKYQGKRRRFPRLSSDYVPEVQEFMYSTCSAVRVSMLISMASSFKRAISLSISAGIECKPGSSLP